jgi:MFS family permease
VSAPASSNAGAGALSAVAPGQAAQAKRWMLPVLLVGQAMAAMDTAIVNVAAPALHRDLGISGALLQMVVAGYILAYAVFLITGARLGEIFGFRRLFLSGLSVFTFASLVCGLAPTTATLIVARVVQGIGAAMMVPQVLSLIQRHFDGHERARAIGLYSMILGLGAALGQLLGGVIITIDLLGLSWRPAFLINVPIGLALLVYARGALPAARDTNQRKLDIAGVFFLTLSMLLIVVALTFGREFDWASWTWISLVCGVIGVSGFLAYEKKVALRGGSPLLDLATIGTAGIRAGLCAVSIGFIGYGGSLFGLALYLQGGLGLSAMVSGMVFTAYALGFGISNMNWSKLPARLLVWTPTTALLAWIAANVGFALTAIVAGWTPAIMLPLLFVAGSSHGLSFGTLVNQMAKRVLPAQAPTLSGLVTTSVQLSIVIGIATLGTVYLGAAHAATAASASRAIAIVTCAIALTGLGAVTCAVRLARSPQRSDA